MKRRFLCLGFILLGVFWAFPCAAQDIDPAREAQYAALRAQYAELKAWRRAHPGSTYWAMRKREKEAQHLRARLYGEFRDVILFHLLAMQREIRCLLPAASDAPYVSVNTLPAENLQKMSANKELLRLLLLQYPDNAMNMPVQTLLELFEKDALLEEYLLDFVLYLRNYERYPSCLADLTLEEKENLRRLHEEGNMEQTFDLLAKGCSKYAARRECKRFVNVMSSDLTHALRPLSGMGALRLTSGGF